MDRSQPEPFKSEGEGKSATIETFISSVDKVGFFSQEREMSRTAKFRAAKNLAMNSDVQNAIQAIQQIEEKIQTAKEISGNAYEEMLRRKDSENFTYADVAAIINRFWKAYNEYTNLLKSDALVSIIDALTAHNSDSTRKSTDEITKALSNLKF